jgi:hypothetical protein
MDQEITPQQRQELDQWRAGKEQEDLINKQREQQTRSDLE